MCALVVVILACMIHFIVILAYLQEIDTGLVLLVTILHDSVEYFVFLVVLFLSNQNYKKTDM